MAHLSRHILAIVTAGMLGAGGLLAGKPASAQDHFLGAIDFAAFSFPPRNWALCDGQLLAIAQNQALFSLLGTNFGGDGRVTFALPDMRGRSPIHDGGSAGSDLTRRVLGGRGGVETVTLNASQVPSHTHALMATASTGNQVLPTDNVFANDAPDETYNDAAPNVNMHANAIGSSPSAPHDNMSPYLVINCIIATQGIFPPRS